MRNQKGEVIAQEQSNVALLRLVRFCHIRCTTCPHTRMGCYEFMKFSFSLGKKGWTSCHFAGVQMYRAHCRKPSFVGNCMVCIFLSHLLFL